MNKCGHKRKPQHKPTADCYKCWIDYMRENPKTIITANDLRRILDECLGIDRVKRAAWISYAEYLSQKIRGG